jgi:DNA-binding response OmpR family regulator
MKILMTDDDEDDRNLSKMAFERLESKNELDFAEDGDELMEVLTTKVGANEKLPDIILLDLNMPGKNGFDTLKEIKSDPRLKQLNVIIFTTSKAEQDRIDSLSRGADGFLVKPPNFNKLVETFRKICNEGIPR